MKNTCFNVLVALGLALSITACSNRAAHPAGAGDSTVTPAPTLTKTLLPSTVGGSFPAAAMLPWIKRLSPSSFSIDGATFEANAYARESCLKFEIQITGDYPIPPTLQSNSFEPVKQLQFLSGSNGDPFILTLELRGGGGGGGASVGSYFLSRDFLYDVKSPLPIPAIIAMVTFHPSLGISGPVRFDIRPTVRPNLACPQLPATTPEG